MALSTASLVEDGGRKRRGGSTASASEERVVKPRRTPSLKSLKAPTSSSSLGTGPDVKPLPLIMFENGTYSVNPEATAFLSTLQAPLGVIAVAGPYRSGKSFLLNRVLLEQGAGTGFNVGPTIQACTKGLWLFTKTVTCVDDNGKHFESIVIDTEGIGALDATSTHDTRIFSLALLLCSYFIYNSVGPIDEAALTNLSLVTKVSQQLRVRSTTTTSTTSYDTLTTNHGSGNSSELAEYFPTFLWLARDFGLQLRDTTGAAISETQYLENALQGSTAV